MISCLSHIKVLNFFWGFVALFMLNISIDAADATPSDVAEDLSFNEQESILEYILEEIIGIENAIPESEDNDATQSSFLKKAAGPDIFCSILTIKQDHFFFLQKDCYSHPRPVSLSHRFIEIVVPPPKV